MNWMSVINWTALALFYIGVFWFFHKHRKKVVKQWGIFFSYHTKRGLKFIKNLAKKLRRFWVVYGYIGIPVVFLLMFGMVVTLVFAIINMFAAPKAAAPAAGIVVPWASTGVHGAVITVSIWYFLIAVVITMLVHEGSHAVIAAAHKKKLKSAGVGLFAIIPFAFVEPDEKQLEKSSTRKKLSVFAAGPFTNIILGSLVILLLFFLILPPIASDMQVNGLEINEINASLPAGLSELEVGDTIVRVDDTSLSGVGAAKASILATSYESALGLPAEKVSALTTEPGQTVELETASGEVFELTAEERASKPSLVGRIGLKLGILHEEDFEPRGVLGLNKLEYNLEPKPGTSSIWLGIFGLLYSIFAWVAIFNIGIGLFNMLPIGPLDGGRMMKATVKHFFKKNKLGLKVFGLISTVVLAVLLFSIFGPYIMGLF